MSLSVYFEAMITFCSTGESQDLHNTTGSKCQGQLLCGNKKKY